MDFSKTLIITGAGSSIPYGLPSAFQLKNNILDLQGRKSWDKAASIYNPGIDDKNLVKKRTSAISHMKAIHQIFKTNITDISNFSFLSPKEIEDETKERILEFISKFAKSRRYSVDLFMSESLDTEAPPEHPWDHWYERLGKALIYYFINYYTYADEFPPLEYRGSDWIEYILNEVLDSPKKRAEFLSNQPKIYTFNYDNVIEKSFSDYFLQLKFPTPEIDVTHIYGKVDFFADKKDPIKAFNSINNQKFEFVEIIRNGISESNKNITEDLINCESCYILGFGYDRLNTKLLFDNLPKDFNFNKIRTTTYGLSPDKQKFISSLFKRGDLFTEKGNPGEGVKCLELIRDKFPIFKN